MLFGLNESTIDANISVDALIVPRHLEESLLSISAYGQTQAEKIYEAALEIHGAYVTTLQRGISEGRLSEAIDNILQEGALSNFFGKIKEFLKKILATIKAMFEKFIAWLDTKIKSDKEFMNKYKKLLLQKSEKVSSMQYKGHSWGIENYPSELATEISSLTAALVNADKTTLEGNLDKGDDAEKAKAKKALDDANAAEAKADGSDSEQRLKEAMKKVSAKLGIGSLDDSDEIVKEYRDKLYGGEADAMTGPDIKGMIAIVEGYNKEKDSAKKAFGSLENQLKKSISDFEKAEKADLNKENPSLKSSTIVAVLKEVSTVINKTSAVYLQAMKDRRDESKAVLAKAVTYKGE